MNLMVNILRQKQIGPFQLTEKSFLPSTVLPAHEHARAYVSFLLTGGYREVSHQEERACSLGTVIWHPGGEVHTDQFDAAGGLLLDLEIARSWLDDAAQDCKVDPQARIFSGGHLYSLGLQLYCALARDGPKVHDLATELLSFFCSGTLDRQPPAWFQHALEMATVIHDQRLSLASVAHEVGVHPVHVARSFRRFTGSTFGDYLAQVRIRTAFDLLHISNHTIADVAYACGFADHAHLSRMFKRSTGRTPSAFRRTVRAGPRWY